MKVKCILSHEKPIGHVFKAGKVYEKDILSDDESRYFVLVREKKEQISKIEEKENKITVKKSKKTKGR